MSSAAIFLLVAVGAAVVGSLLLYLAHRVRRPRPPDFSEQLRRLAPNDTKRASTQQSGIVHLDPGDDEEG